MKFPLHCLVLFISETWLEALEITGYLRQFRHERPPPWAWILTSQNFARQILKSLHYCLNLRYLKTSCMWQQNGALQPGYDGVLHRARGQGALKVPGNPMRFVSSVFIHFCIGGNQEVKKKPKLNVFSNWQIKEYHPWKCSAPKLTCCSKCPPLGVLGWEKLSNAWQMARAGGGGL